MMKETTPRSFIVNAIKEDIGEGDHTSLACIGPRVTGKAELIVKQDAIIAGVRIARTIFQYLDQHLEIEENLPDGAAARPGDIAFTVSGRARSILTAERLVLNVLQRMTGIATFTNRFVESVAGTDVKILDTRKTVPGLRSLDKEAVRLGGGHNHRFGLFDMILIKDNHIDFCGGITEAIQSAHDYLYANRLQLDIEIEARNVEEVSEILQAGEVQRILLDNFELAELKEALDMIGDRCETEVSGGITLDNVRKYAECKPDFISVGALTHTAPSVDLSLKAIKQ